MAATTGQTEWSSCPMFLHFSLNLRSWEASQAPVSGIFLINSLNWEVTSMSAHQLKKPLKPATVSDSVSCEINLHAYQVDAIRLMVAKPACGLFMDPGLGKTLCSYVAYDTLREAKAVRDMLVVAPLRPAMETWPAELMKWGFDYSLTLLHGAKKEDRLLHHHDIYVINYEGLDWLFSAMNRHKLKFDMVVFDESSKLRNTRTMRFKLIRHHLNSFKRRYILTGTPAPNGLENLFGQLYVLDGGRRLGQFITHFRREFFDQDMYLPFPKYTVKPGSAEKIHDRIKDIVYRADDSVLDLPKKIDMTRSVVLPPKVRLIYDDLENNLIAQIEERTVYAANAGVATQKLRQVVNGGLYLDSKASEWTKLHDVKTEHTLELLDELEGKPTIVAYEFHHDLERLLEALGQDTPYLGGGVSVKRGHEIQEAWNRGDVPILLGQPASMAHGLNLQGTGRAVIWHSLTWDYENYYQLIKRIWRQGQKHRVFNYHLVGKDTVDEAIMEALTRKAETQKDFFSAVVNYLKRRRQ